MRVLAVPVRLVLLVSILGLAANVLAQEDLFIRTSLSSEQVVPAVTAEGSGHVTAVLIGNVLVVVGDYQNLSSPIDRQVAGGAHIHQAAKGENGGIVFNLNIDGGTEGAFTGVFTLSNEQIQALEGGQYYVQLHTETNQPGELRAQLASNITMADLVGIWDTSAGTHFIEFRADGSFLAAGSVPALGTGCPGCFEGRYELAGSLMRFMETSNSYCRTEEPGSYQVALTDAGDLKVVLHEDAACAARAGLSNLGLPWLRVSP